MTGNPYYWMVRTADDKRTRLAMATLWDADQRIFLVEGQRTTVAGKARGLTIQTADVGRLFLCAGGEEGWFVVCRLEEE